MDQHELTSPDLRVRIAADGAELVSVRDTAGAEYLWQAGPVWPRHAPLLFPIVGRLADDTLVHRGQAYRLTQHGFARDRRFEWAERGLATCRLVLRDDAQTRALYPFAFRLDVDYALDALTLRCTMTLHNTGDEDLPASMGAHPRLRVAAARRRGEGGPHAAVRSSGTRAGAPSRIGPDDAGSGGVPHRGP